MLKRLIGLSLTISRLAGKFVERVNHLEHVYSKYVAVFNEEA